MKTSLISAVALVCTALAPVVTHAADQACAPRDDILNHLKSKYNEERRSIGLTSNNTVLEVYASIDGDTWSVVMSYPDGTSCVMAVGSAFEQIALEQVKNSGQKL